MDWDDLYDDSREPYKKIGNTILPVYVGAGWMGLVKHSHRWSFSQRLMMLPK